MSSDDPDDPRGEPGVLGRNERIARELRLGRVLQQRVREEGGYSALARAITKSVPEAERHRKLESPNDVLIDRRRLKAIIDAEPNVMLSIRELSYLDRYLDRFGEGLAHNPIFERDDLLRTVAKTGHVTFLLGTKPDRERWNVSHWDVLALAEIQRGISASEVTVRFDIKDVPLGSDGAEPSLLGDHGPSLVVVGSSQSNAASDVMQCAMLGLKRPQDADRRPYGFVWRDAPAPGPASLLNLDLEELEADHPAEAERVQRAQASALVAKGEVRLDDLSRKRERGPSHGTSYGICAAQRRKNGQIWIVVAGLTGVTTYVAAKLVGKLSTRLHEPPTGRPSPVYWGVVQARVPEFRDLPVASQREFEDEGIISHYEFAVASRGSG